MKYLLKNLKFLSHNQYNHPTVKNELLNHRHCGKLFLVLKNTIVSTDPLKEYSKNNSDKSTSFENFHTVILKTWRRVNIKISKFNNNGNNSYEIKTQNLQDERFGCSFLKIRTNIELWTKRLVKASKRTSTHDGLTGRHTRVVSPLIVQKTFFNMIEIIFSMYKDPRIKR